PISFRYSMYCVQMSLSSGVLNSSGRKSGRKKSALALSFLIPFSFLFLSFLGPRARDFLDASSVLPSLFPDVSQVWPVLFQVASPSHSGISSSELTSEPEIL